MGILGDICKKMQSVSNEVLPTVSVKLKSFQKLDSEKQQILMEAARELLPLVRAELEASWTKSNMQSKTGNLYASAVSGARIEITFDGIQIKYGSDASTNGTSTYKYGAAQDHGWVNGTGGKKFKQKLKKIKANGGKIGDNTVHAGHHFFKIEIKNLQKKYSEIWQQRVKAIVG